MDLTLAERFLYLTPKPLLAFCILVLVAAGFVFGGLARRILYRQREDLLKEAGQGFLINGSIGVLALIMGFTFSIAVGHFESRRRLIVEEANAVLSTYAYSQAVESGDAKAMRRLLLAYTETRLAAFQTDDVGKIRPLVARSELLEDQIEASAILVARQEPTGISNGYLQSAREVGKSATLRLAAKRIHVPSRVYAAILINLAIVAAGIGFEFTGPARYVVATVLLLLLTISLVLIIDLDRPLNSAITESQSPMEDAQRRISRDELSSAVAAAALAGQTPPSLLGR